MWILSPLSWLLLSLAAFVVVWLFLRRRRWMLVVCGGLAAFSIFAMTPMFANTLLYWLESESATSDFCTTSPPDTAVVLAGGLDRLPKHAREFSVINIASRRRAELASEWWSAKPGRKLVFAGGSRVRGFAPESALLTGYARRLGVDAPAMRQEDASRNTWQNAKNLAALSPAVPRRVVLITSAMHMPRARYSMRQAGFQVCPMPADFRFEPFDFPGYFIPQGSSMQKTESALHEIVGNLYYRLRVVSGRR